MNPPTPFHLNMKTKIPTEKEIIHIALSVSFTVI
jgi:hypothetical protein